MITTVTTEFCHLVYTAEVPLTVAKAVIPRESTSWSVSFNQKNVLTCIRMQSDQNSTAEITVKGACLQEPESLLQLLHLACRKSKLLQILWLPHNPRCRLQHTSSSSGYLLTPHLF